MDYVTTGDRATPRFWSSLVNRIVVGYEEDMLLLAERFQVFAIDVRGQRPVDIGRPATPSSRWRTVSTS